jgi:hypothetical protein
MKRIAPVWVATAKDRPPTVLMDEMKGDICAVGAGIADVTIARLANVFRGRHGEKTPGMWRKVTLRLDELSIVLNGTANKNQPSRDWVMPLRKLKPAADQSWHEAHWFQEWLQLARRDYHGRS